jgi:hypothetical protein
MHNPNGRSLGAAAHRDVVTGLRAQVAFLLDAICSEASTPADRSIALLALLSDADTFTPVLTPHEATAIGSILTSATGAVAGAMPTALVVVPSETDDNLALEGTSVRCAVVGPATTAEVGSATLETGSHVVSTESIVDAGVDAVLEVAVDGEVVGQVSLPPGPRADAEFEFAIPRPSHVTIRVANRSTNGSARWFQTTVVAQSGPSERVSSIAANQLAALRSTDPTSVFTPPTGEPMRLADVSRLQSLYQRFSGERIFVMGNGPSLNKTPLHLLKDDFVFAVNRISLLFERIDWRPTFYTAFDVRVVPDNAEEFAALDLEYKFFSSRYKELLGEKSNHYWYHAKGFYEGFGSGFESTVPYSGFGGGGTIGVMAIQLAWYLGFSDIFLIGTDVSYSVPETVVQTGKDEFGDGVKLELTSTKDDDGNHFDPTYFGKGKKWHNPNVRDMKVGFGRAARYLDARGGSLRNATVGGDLDTVERVEFESLF